MKGSHPCFTNSPLHKCLVRLRAARQHRDVLLHDGALGAAQAAHPAKGTVCTGSRSGPPRAPPTDDHALTPRQATPQSASVQLPQAGT